MIAFEPMGYDETHAELVERFAVMTQTLFRERPQPQQDAHVCLWERHNLIALAELAEIARREAYRRGTR